MKIKNPPMRLRHFQRRRITFKGKALVGLYGAAGKNLAGREFILLCQSKEDLVNVWNYSIVYPDKLHEKKHAIMRLAVVEEKKTHFDGEDLI